MQWCKTQVHEAVRKKCKSNCRYLISENWSKCLAHKRINLLLLVKHAKKSLSETVNGFALIKSWGIADSMSNVVIFSLSSSDEHLI